MATENIFQSLRERILRSNAYQPMEKRALHWFRTFQSDLMQWRRNVGKPTWAQLEQEPIAKRVVSPSKIVPGSLYFFLYEPKGLQKLDYYDRFPFVLVLDQDEMGFRGLNFHYLDYFWRAWLFDNLYERRRKHSDPLKVILPFTYDILANSTKYKQFRPCYRRYLFAQLRSPMLQVGESEWDVALWLPVELYRKASVTEVWKDSQRMFS